MLHELLGCKRSNFKIAFVKAEIKEVEQALLNWLTPLAAKNNNALSSKVISGTIQSAYAVLFPLTTVEIRKYVLLPTASLWTGIVDNFSLGTDRTCPFVLAEKTKTDHIYLSFNELTQECLVDYYSFLNEELEIVRTVGVTKENGWKFHQHGKPFGFEEIENYSNKVIKTRFTFNSLQLFLSHFNINAFDNDFYFPLNKHGFLIEKCGPLFSGTKEIQKDELK